jgi:hypothetical protein
LLTVALSALEEWRKKRMHAIEMGWSVTPKRAETLPMRSALPLLAVTIAMSGCSLSAGAGVGARFGGGPSLAGPNCDSFESCDLAYQDAQAELARCREEGGDCDGEERNVVASYGVLREQTQQELETLRGEAAERDSALAEAEERAEAAQLEKDPDCAGRGRPVEQAPVTRHGNGWFEPEQPANAH